MRTDVLPSTLSRMDPDYDKALRHLRWRTIVLLLMVDTACMEYAGTGVLALRRRTTYILVYILCDTILYGAKGSLQQDGEMSCISALCSCPRNNVSLRMRNFSDIRSSIRYSTVLRKYTHTLLCLLQNSWYSTSNTIALPSNDGSTWRVLL